MSERADTAVPATGERLECKICWYVYDPAVGDPFWHVPAATPFAALPPHWSCPTCAATQDQFLRLDNEQ
jgi:rubredoxin